LKQPKHFTLVFLGGSSVHGEKIILYSEHLKGPEPYLEKAKELGGGVDTLKKEIPKVGYFAHVLDPDGNIVGLFEDLKKE
jgi:predicted enzyme related to lactoylglutathione lyase